MKFDNYMILDFPSKSSNEAFARSAVACFSAVTMGVTIWVTSVRALPFTAAGGGSSFTASLSSLGFFGGGGTAAGGQAQDHSQSQEDCKKLLHFFHPF